MGKVTGRAKKYDGTAIDYVSIFKWENGKCFSQVKPDASGVWTYASMTPKKIGITYVANGCEPITHGAYDVLGVVPRKWWRVIRIENIRSEASTGSDIARSVATLIFINDKELPTNNPDKGFANSQLNATYSASKAFDNNPATFANNDYNNPTTKGLDWYIGYQFEEPVIVTEVKVQMRSDVSAGGIDQEWQKADIQCSDDGVTWFDVAYIRPLVPERSNALITTEVIATE